VEREESRTAAYLPAGGTLTFSINVCTNNGRSIDEIEALWLDSLDLPPIQEYAGIECPERLDGPLRKPAAAG